MPLAPGSRLGPYEVLSPIGKGGMGEVFRARDTKLDRDVAVKVLPDGLARDPDRLARFEREAKALAALNHPNIAQIYAVEGHAIVMELVPGDTLSALAASAPLPLDRVLDYAAQMAAALEAAHDRGIIHRDFKPGNVMVTPGGQVKVLDFGLVGRVVGTDTVDDPDHSPTLTVRATQAGVILGTAGYMAPEQASGRPVDKRADIWSFGVVLWELLAGRRMFEGETISHVLAAVLTKEPDLTAVPERVRAMLARCLEKDPKKRLRDIGDALPLVPAHETASAAMPAPSRRGWLVVTIATAAVAIIALLGVSVVHFREAVPEASAPVRFEIPVPANTSIDGGLALSPDGKQLAYVLSAGGQQVIWVRPLDALEARALPGTEGVRGDIFWSPDSRSLGFSNQGKLKRIDIAGGPPQILCDVGGLDGGTWSPRGVIVFRGGGLGSEGLMSVSQAGGAPVVLIREETDRHVGPHFLPDGNHFIYAVLATTRNQGALYLGSLDGTSHTRLTESSSRGVFVASTRPGEPGHLLFRRANTLMAQPFNDSTLRLIGDPFPLAEPVTLFSVSATGALAYRGLQRGSGTQLTWFDRMGTSLGPLGPLGDYNDLALSPDGTRVVVNRLAPGSGDRDLWMIDARRGIPTRFTFSPGLDWDPVWSPDSIRVAYTSTSNAAEFSLWWKDAAGTGQEGPLPGLGNERGRAKDWSDDGKSLLYVRSAGAIQGDLWVWPLDGESKPVPYLQTPFLESMGQFSPGVDGPRWVAYLSNESGRNEIYVQSFPAGQGKFQISSGGGVQPRWRGDGKELFYIAPDGSLMAVDVKTAPTFEAGAPRALFPSRITGGGTTNQVFRYDVAPDGRRFLINATVESEAQAPPTTVVLHWQSSLAR